LKILNESNSPSRTITRDTVVFRELLKKLDNPEKSFKSIHVTGTNGKGSVTLKTAYILEKAGYKTGVYTSPHIFSFFERIKINRNNIDEKYFTDSILKIHDIAQKNSMQLTFFEVTYIIM
jgi:dihydrofolate synthase/folylpolyglutamate synthase